MLITFTRTIILFILIVVIMRIMGKGQIGELQPFELVIALMLSELAAIPMQDTSIPLIDGIIPILTLLLAQITFSYISIKSKKARKIICGTPSVLIANGKIVEEELIKERFSITDLLEMLRSKDFPNIADVEYAILETNGQLSIIPKSQKRPVTPEDLNIETKYEGMPLALILDGEIDYKNLSHAQLTVPWLEAELKKMGVHNLDDVLIASLDTSGNLYYQLKLEKRRKNIEGCS
ncbi:DUF421 domain-containing protein [Bacillota bacterium LX-D]|nr:DUF421 domain-containing protein [Bacillota bacterium LX-D]